MDLRCDFLPVFLYLLADFTASKMVGKEVELMMSETVLSVRDLVKRYETDTILHGISLEIRKGEVSGIEITDENETKVIQQFIEIDGDNENKLTMQELEYYSSPFCYMENI